MSAAGHAVRLARIDVTRMLRKQTDWGGSSSSLLGVAMYVLLLLGGTAGGAYLGSRLGEALASGTLGPGTIGAGGDGVGGITPLAAARGILALLWLVLTIVYVVRAVGQRGTLAEPEGVLTVVPTREALAGVFLAEYAYYLLWLLGPALGLGAGLAVGAGTPWPALAVPLGIAGAGVGSIAVGYPLGLGVRHVATRFPFVVRHKVAIIVLAFVAYFVVLSSGAWTELMERLLEPMTRTPVAWYADVAFLGTPGMAASTVHAAGAVVLTAAFGAVALLAGTRVAERHWFSDPALAGATEPEVTEEEAEPGVERRLEPLLGPATASLVALSWRRAIRSPLKFLYAFYPILFMAGIFADIVQTGRVPAYLPYVILVSVAWAAGVVFTLNPLGDQGAVLPSTLLSPVDGGTFVRAVLLAGLLVAVPVGTVATAAVGYLSPLETEELLLLVVASPIAIAVSAVLSVGIGMAFPRFEATNVTRSMKTVLPSRWGFVLFSLHLFLTAAAAAVVYQSTVRELAAALLSWALPFGLSVAAGTLYWIAGALLVPLLLAPLLAYRYAVRRYDRYVLS